MRRLSLWFHIVSFYALALIWLAGTVIIGVSYPLWLLGVASFWFIGFLILKSTKVPADPTEVPFTLKVKLSYEEYDQWANQVVRLAMNQRYFDSTYVHWTQKMSLLMESFGASLHVWAPHLSKLLLTILDIPLILLFLSPDSAGWILQIPAVVSAILMGLSSGWAWGLFYRWLRAKW